MVDVVVGFHHVEIWVSDLQASRSQWRWILARVGFALAQEWASGESWHGGDSYLTLTESPTMVGDIHDRRRPGMNHLALHGGSAEDVDATMAGASAHGWRALYSERYPHAGGPAHYAGWLENDSGFKVEIVASSEEGTVSSTS